MWIVRGLNPDRPIGPMCRPLDQYGTSQMTTRVPRVDTAISTSAVNKGCSRTDGKSSMDHFECWFDAKFERKMSYGVLFQLRGPLDP